MSAGSHDLSCMYYCDRFDAACQSTGCLNVKINVIALYHLLCINWDLQQSSVVFFGDGAIGLSTDQRCRSIQYQCVFLVHTTDTGSMNWIADREARHHDCGWQS